MTGLGFRAGRSIVIFTLALGAVVFAAAGTLHYWQAWVYWTISTAMSILSTIELLRRDPALLERRLSAGPTKEKRPAQKRVMVGASACFLALLVVPALDRRFGGSSVPFPVVVAGDVLVVVGYYLILLVFRANTFAAATIEIAKGHRVIDSGPYSIVRHPMYSCAMLYLVGTPLALGSYWGLVVIAVMIPILAWRVVDEERFLVESLPGYIEYRERVPYRLLPFVW